MAARDRVRQRMTDGSRVREWAAPCLLVSHEPGSIIRGGINHVITPDHRRQVINIEALEKVRRMVGRRQDRYQAWRNFQQPEHKIQVLIGAEESGTTTFARMFMERCVLCGHQLRYIDMRDRGRQNREADFLDLLLAIRCGDNSRLSEAMPSEHFTSFDQTLTKWLGMPINPHESFLIPAIDAAHTASENSNFEDAAGEPLLSGLRSYWHGASAAKAERRGDPHEIERGGDKQMQEPRFR
ncbi:MAG: hypothetical protein SH847_06515 [Roseiflexaceae bacterium]|nr:hypothetical protein [Roseiflexaceae bacterium]